jgi:prolyl-tRNA synthetase
MSKLFSQTLREAPAEAEVASHRLLLRAGFIRQMAAGIFSYLPLARRALTKIENIMRQEMDEIGGQEITMPVVQPADLWKETGRWSQIDAEMGRFKDRSGREMALAMTHEEAVADLVRREVRSYRQLPQLVYHIQTKWRDDPRPRAGLIRVREFTMKDSYSLDAGWEGLDAQYRAHYQAYFNIYHRCGIQVKAVKADVGMMGGQSAHEFMYLTPIGEDTLLICEECGYSANRQIARFLKPVPPSEDPLPVEKIATPETKTIEDLANFLGVPKARTAKAVFMMAEVATRIESGSQLEQMETPGERFIFAVVRGDMEVNETKLVNALKAKSLRPATEDEIRAVGAVPGYASPIGIRDQASRDKVGAGKGLIVLVDDAIPTSPNLVAGANEEGYHLRNVNYGRDYLADVVSDIAAAQGGDACPECGNLLRAERGVEVGNIFKLGTWFSDAMGCTFLNADGQARPVIMGSYGIGSGRLLACIAEEHHDEYGLVWPVTLAPYQVHLVSLGKKKGPGLSEKGAGTGDQGPVTGEKEGRDAAEISERLYADLQAAGLELLFDDRDESPGVKFNDADLIGLPIRLTVSERSLKAGGVEFKRRDQAEKSIIPLDEAISHIQAEIAALQAEVAKTVVKLTFEE